MRVEASDGEDVHFNLKWPGVERARMETENNESSIVSTWVPALSGTDELDRGPKGQGVEVPHSLVPMGAK